jgi:hypothetical protein
VNADLFDALIEGTATPTQYVGLALVACAGMLGLLFNFFSAVKRFRGRR